MVQVIHDENSSHPPDRRHCAAECVSVNTAFQQIAALKESMKQLHEDMGIVFKKFDESAKGESGRWILIVGILVNIILTMWKK